MTYFHLLHRNLIFFTIFVLLLNNEIKSQGTQSDLLVEYSVSHKIDTSNNYFIHYPLFLFANNKKSYCISKNEYENDSIIKKTSYQLNKVGDAYVINYQPANIKKVSSFESAIVFKDFENETQTEQVKIGANIYIIKDSVFNPIWKLSDSTKIINGYTCKFAESFFKGRWWKVWYCPEISISNGPWKLHGLPGLIVEAQDLTNNITFSITSITKKNAPLRTPESRNTITRKQYFKLLTAYAEDPIGFIGQQSGTKISLNDISGPVNKPTGQGVKLKLPNNPIEVE